MINLTTKLSLSLTTKFLSAFFRDLNIKHFRDFKYQINPIEKYPATQNY